MKLADLIPARSEQTNAYGMGWNLAIDQMAALTALAEQAGYRLVLAMPQHIEPMEAECPECGCRGGHTHKCSYAEASA